MYSLRKQRTIAATVSVDGYGYWTGHDVHVEFQPAEPDTGIVFVRQDLQPAVQIQAVVANRIETPRRTTLSRGGSSVEMIEHIMAALAGLEIDNCRVCVNRPEMPGLDGSAIGFVEVLDRVGVKTQAAARAKLVIR